LRFLRYAPETKYGTKLWTDGHTDDIMTTFAPRGKKREMYRIFGKYIEFSLDNQSNKKCIKYTYKGIQRTCFKL
jgi:hypothetical protein